MSLPYFYSLSSVLWLQTARVVVWTSVPLLFFHAPLAFYSANVPLLVSVPVSLLLQLLSLVFRAALIDASSAESLPPRWFQLVSAVFRRKVLLHVTLQVCVILALAIISAFLSAMFIHPNLNYVALSVPCNAKWYKETISQEMNLHQQQKCVNTDGVFYLLVAILVSVVSIIRWHAYGMSRVLRSVPLEWNSPSLEEQEDFIQKQPQRTFKLPSEVLWARVRRAFGIAFTETIVVTVLTVMLTFLSVFLLSFTHRGKLSSAIQLVLDASNSLTQPYREGASGVSSLDSSSVSSAFSVFVTTILLSSSLSLVYALHASLLPLFLVDRVDINDLLSGAIVSPIQPKELSGSSDALLAVLPVLPLSTSTGSDHHNHHSQMSSVVSKIDLSLAALRTVKPKSLAHYLVSFPTEWIALRSSRNANFAGDIGYINSSNTVSYIPPVWKQSPPPLPITAAPDDEFIPGELTLTNLSLSISEFSENENAILTAWQTRMAVADWALASKEVSVNGESEGNSAVSQLSTLLRLLVSTVTKSNDATRPELWIDKESFGYNPFYSIAIPTSSPWLFILRDVVLNSSSPLASTCQLLTDKKRVKDGTSPSPSTYSYDFLSYSTTLPTSQAQLLSEHSENSQQYQRRNNVSLSSSASSKASKNRNTRKIQFSEGEDNSSGAHKAMTVEELGSPTDVHKSSSDRSVPVTSRRFVRSLGAVAMSSAERRRLFAASATASNPGSNIGAGGSTSPAEWMDVVWACTALIDTTTISLLTRASVNSFSLAQYSPSRPPVWVLKSSKRRGGEGGSASFWDTLVASAASAASRQSSTRNINQPSSSPPSRNENINKHQPSSSPLSSQNVATVGVVKHITSRDAVINWALLMKHMSASLNVWVVGVNLSANLFLSTFLLKDGGGGKSLELFSAFSMLVFSVVGQVASLLLRSSVLDLKALELFAAKKMPLSSTELLRMQADQVALSAVHVVLWRHFLNQRVSLPVLIFSSFTTLALSLVMRGGFSNFSIFKVAKVYITWTLDQIDVHDPSRESDERQKALLSAPEVVADKRRELTLDDIIGGVSLPSPSSTQLCIDLLRTLSPDLSKEELTNLASSAASMTPHNFTSSSFAALEEVIRSSTRKPPFSKSSSNSSHLSTTHRRLPGETISDGRGRGGEGEGLGGLFASVDQPERHSSSVVGGGGGGGGVSQLRSSSTSDATAREITQIRSLAEKARHLMRAIANSATVFVAIIFNELGLSVFSTRLLEWKTPVRWASSSSHQLRPLHPFFKKLSPFFHQIATALLPNVLRTCSEEEASLLSDIRATAASAELLTSLALGGLDGDDAQRHQVPLSLPVILYSFASCVAASGLLAASPRYNQTFSFGCFWEWAGFQLDVEQRIGLANSDPTKNGISVIELVMGRSSTKKGGVSTAFTVAAGTNVRPGLASLSAVLMKCLVQLFSSKIRGVSEHLQVLTDKAPSHTIRSILRLARFIADKR